MISIKEETNRFIPSMAEEGDAEGAEASQDRRGALAMGVPMAIGFAVIPIGKLAGRPDIDMRRHRVAGAVRQIQSDVGMQPLEKNTLLSHETRRQPNAAAYNWTLSGADRISPSIREKLKRKNNWHDTRRNSRPDPIDSRQQSTAAQPATSNAV
eukprot:Selendium_serpulae@DN6273_c0_g1_i3.p2